MFCDASKPTNLKWPGADRVRLQLAGRPFRDDRNRDQICQKLILYRRTLQVKNDRSGIWRVDRCRSAAPAAY